MYRKREQIEREQARIGAEIIAAELAAGEQLRSVLVRIFLVIYSHHLIALHPFAAGEAETSWL